MTRDQLFIIEIHAMTNVGVNKPFSSFTEMLKEDPFLLVYKWQLMNELLR